MLKMKKPYSCSFYNQRRTGPVHLNRTGSVQFTPFSSQPSDLYPFLMKWMCFVSF